MIFATHQTIPPSLKDEFRYSVASRFPGTGLQTSTETDTYTKTVFKGKACVEKTEETGIPGATRTVKLIKHTWIQKTPSGFKVIASSVGNRPPHMVSKGPASPLTLKLGLEWGWQDKLKSGSSFVMHAKVLRKESVAVPAGKFECWVVESNTKESDKGQTFTDNGTYWWSLKLGEPVKWTTSANVPGGKMSLDTVLTSYSLRPKPHRP